LNLDVVMLIPISVALPITPGAPVRPKLPPVVAKLGDAESDELVLIELQGSLEVEGSKAGQLVGTLRMREVSYTRPDI
jgi:chromosome transmission fidelity protein 8